MMIRSLLLIVIAWALISCSLLPADKTPLSKRYMLSNVNTQHYPLKKKEKAITLLIGSPQAAPAYETSNMLYVEEAYKLQAFSQHRWIAPPADMLSGLLTQSLRNTKHFHAVVATPFVGKTDYRLETRLLYLKQDFLHTNSQIKIAIEATLIDSENNHIVASHRFRGSQTTNENTPYAGVVAANKVMGKLLTQLARFTVKETKKS